MLGSMRSSRICFTQAGVMFSHAAVVSCIFGVMGMMGAEAVGASKALLFASALYSFA